MNFTVGIVSLNLVIQANFIEFQDNRIFTNFEATALSGPRKRDF